MNKLQKSKRRRNTAAVLAAIVFSTSVFPTSVSYAGSTPYDYSNAIYNEGIEDTYLYDLTDKVVTTKTKVKRTLPKTSGKYERRDYPIPLENKVPSKEAFELVKAENKELMDTVETAIKEKTLTKHIAADGQFYGSIVDVTGVEKKIYINTNSKGTHSLASYVPAGEIATVSLSDEALAYAKKGLIKISVGMTMIDATSYDYNKDKNNRMPYLGKTFSVSEKETQVGTPFGGMLYLEVDSAVPSGLQLVAEVKGVVDAPYYELGQTTKEEWQEARKAPGLFAEIRTPYLRFMVPSYFIREVEDMEQALKYWTNATCLSATLMAEETRNAPMALVFDDYITAGVAYASVGSWICNLPTEWAANALDYDSLMEQGSWGVMHEINHHYQSRRKDSWKEWGLGSWNDYSEITNNVLSAISYMLYSNIASYRGEEGLEDWNKVADPYSSLKQAMFEQDEYYKGVPNIGNFAFSTLAHEIGPLTLAEIIKSTYDGGTFHGIDIPPYDYDAETSGKQNGQDRYDDFAYRINVASKRDYTWYLKETLGWPLSEKAVLKMKALGYEQAIPVQSVYAMGEVGRETGGPYYVPSTGYVFDFENSLVSPGKATVISVSDPKYGTLTKLDDGKYSYKPADNMPAGKKEEFILTVKAEADGITSETKLNCTIGLLYNSVNVEHHAITKWDVYEALDALKISSPYKTTSSSGMRIASEEGNNLAMTSGYFSVLESGDYTFQAFGDDRAVFELNYDDGSKLQSLTVDYASSAKDAYTQEGATHFTTFLEAGKAYRYTLIANNNGGIGWADVNIRRGDEDVLWTAISSVASKKEDLAKGSARSFTAPDPYYVRPSKTAASNLTTIKGVHVISHPQGVVPNGDASSANEGNPDHMLDGDASTYFHSAYVQSDKTPMPHDYVFDLGSSKSFNQIEALYRRTGDDCGVIGDYEVYVADEYDGDNTKWTLAASDLTRKGNKEASKDIKVALPATQARYVMLRALNNRGSYDLSILAEVTFSMSSSVESVIAQNSSYIQYEGSWSKDIDGTFANGATYNTKNGYFRYCFTGKESNLYVTKDAVAEVRIDGGNWEKTTLSGSLREPSATFVMDRNAKHSVEVRAIGQELALNMISTDGLFYQGTIVSTENTLAIKGADDIEISAGKAKEFDLMEGISYTDSLGLSGLQVQASGKVEIPAPGTKQSYKIKYTVADSYGNTASADRQITVTNYIPEIEGLSDVTIIKGQGKDFDYNKGVTVTDYEDGKVSSFEVEKIDVSTLSAGEYWIEYKSYDADGNLVVARRKITVKENTAPVNSPQPKPPVTTASAKPQSTKTPVIKLSSIKKLSASKVSTKEIKLSWSKVAGATGYKVYRYNAKTKKYALVKTITKNTTLSYKDTKLASGTAYKYKVVAYNKKENAAAKQITTATKPATVKIKKITRGSKKATIQWTKITGASGYEVYRSTKKAGAYKKIATLNKQGTVKYVNKKLKAKTTYYYKLRAYKIVNGKKVYGAYSAAKSIKIIK